jgi:hypothetical protein
MRHANEDSFGQSRVSHLLFVALSLCKHESNEMPIPKIEDRGVFVRERLKGKIDEAF